MLSNCALTCLAAVCILYGLVDYSPAISLHNIPLCFLLLRLSDTVAMGAQ